MVTEQRIEVAIQFSSFRWFPSLIDRTERTVSSTDPILSTNRQQSNKNISRRKTCRPFDLLRVYTLRLYLAIAIACPFVPRRAASLTSDFSSYLVIVNNYHRKFIKQWPWRIFACTYNHLLLVRSSVRVSRIFCRAICRVRVVCFFICVWVLRCVRVTCYHFLPLIPSVYVLFFHFFLIIIVFSRKVRQSTVTRFKDGKRLFRVAVLSRVTMD